jgi:hypothetical protein
MKNKMEIIKNKKASEGAAKPMTEIIGWIILFAFLIFAFLWYTGLKDYIIAILKEIF